MLTQEQLIQAFTSGVANSPPPSQAPMDVLIPPPEPPVTIAQFNEHLQTEAVVKNAIAQHFDTLYQEVAAIKNFQKWIVVCQSGVMIFLIIFLMMFFPIWEQWQRQRSAATSTQPPVAVRPSQSAV